MVRDVLSLLLLLFPVQRLADEGHHIGLLHAFGGMSIPSCSGRTVLSFWIWERARMDCRDANAGQRCARGVPDAGLAPVAQRVLLPHVAAALATGLGRIMALSKQWDVGPRQGDRISLDIRSVSVSRIAGILPRLVGFPSWRRHFEF